MVVQVRTAGRVVIFKKRGPARHRSVDARQIALEQSANRIGKLRRDGECGDDAGSTYCNISAHRYHSKLIYR